MPESPFWTPDTEAMALLETHGGPFERRAFRDAHIAAIPGSSDVSFGAAGADGSTAAIALIRRGRTADSLPPSGYGGVRASRPLVPGERRAFLRAARRSAGTASLTARSLEFGELPAGGRVFATASVVDVSRPRSYSRLARRSLRRAELAGAAVARSRDTAPFLELYRAAAAGWGTRYPEALIEQLVESGAAVLHTVEVEGEAISSLLTLVDGDHWMCWLAAQNDRGRDAAASYVAYDAVFEEASAAVAHVNLGASAPGSGGAQFKSYLGASEVPMLAWSDSVPGWSPARAAATRAAQLVARIRGRQTRFS